MWKIILKPKVVFCNVRNNKELSVCRYINGLNMQFILLLPHLNYQVSMPL
jgi:hypothetical protein